MVILIGTQFRRTNPDAFQHTQSKKFGMHCNTENKQQVVKISQNFTVKIVITVIKKEEEVTSA